MQILNKEIFTCRSTWAAFVAGMMVASAVIAVVLKFAPTKAQPAGVTTPSAASIASPSPPPIPPTPAINLAPPNPDPALETLPRKEWTREQRLSRSIYADEFSFKQRDIFYKDPFIWALSQEFAERFGMPAAWVEPGLKGAYALAWRTTTIGSMPCGHGGNPNACWPPFTCQLDLYVDTKAIPWSFDDIQQDFDWHGLSSMSYVPRRPPAARRLRYTNVGLPGLKGEPFVRTNFKSKETKYTAGEGFSILYFDRNYAPGIALIGFAGACPDSSVEGDYSWHFYSVAEQNRSRGQNPVYAHTIEIPSTFYKKIRPIYLRDVEESRKTNSAYQEAIRRFAPQ